MTEIKFEKVREKYEEAQLVGIERDYIEIERECIDPKNLKLLKVGEKADTLTDEIGQMVRLEDMLKRKLEEFENKMSLMDIAA